MVYAQGMNPQLWDIETRLDSVEESNKKNGDNNVRVKKLVEQTKNRSESRMNTKKNAMLEGEMREWEAKILNFITHGVQEFDEMRMQWYQKKIKTFKVFELSLTKEDIKFCHRVYEKVNHPGCSLLVFRSVLLHYTRYLAKTEFEEILTMLGLTRRQY
jgi:hypothetical protein